MHSCRQPPRARIGLTVSFLAEFRRAARVLGFPLSERMVAFVFVLFDKNGSDHASWLNYQGDGQLDHGEFLHLMRDARSLSAKVCVTLYSAAREPPTQRASKKISASFGA